MGVFVKGDVVVVPFPFSDLSNAKRRPAFVIADLTGDDVILCQITTQHRHDGYSVPLTGKDFTSGGLKHDSNIRPNRLFTADSNLIVRREGKVTHTKAVEVIQRLVQIIESSP
jgi:mRNA interferase MazF